MKDEIIHHPSQATMFTDELKEHIEPIVKGITFNNCHLIAKKLYELDPKAAEGLLNELKAAEFFSDIEKEENKNAWGL